jgi:hypothetical protein
MTLPEGKTARVFSGRISIFANSTKNSNTVEVTISRAPDLIAPPTPAITDPLSWKSADDSIITAGYDDGESSIAKFEAEISGKIVELIGSQSQDFTPTYFNPFAPAKNVYLRDLPEGKYRLRLRSIDVWGNVSAWSKSVETYVDRGLPLVTSDFVATSIDQNSTSVIWRGARDQGIGLCDTLIYNDDGFINYRSLDSISPKLVLRTASTLKAKAQLFDCLGNGITGNIDLKVDFVSADKPRRTGKWTNLPLQNGVKALRCYGKCTVSASITGKAQALISQGSVSISIPGGKSETFANMTPQFKFSEAIDVGKRSRVIRITGSNFTFGGISRIEASLGDFKPILAIKSIVDPTLNDSTQADLSRFGFNSKDFTQDWTVLPMARGTSLLDPTLDLCSATYLSESGRQSRRQVAITKSSSRYQFLSSETVKYISEKAAQAALSELKRNLETCMINKGGVEGGLFVPYNFQDLPKFASKLVPEDKRIIVRAQIGSSGSERQLLAFYQFSGAYFSGLYVVLPGLSQFSDGEVLRWFDVAEVLAGRLVTGSGE